MPVPSRRAVVQPARRLLTDDVFERLRAGIVRGSLTPGERIHDAELAADLGLSRATVRSALLRLTEIGLVEAVPNLYTRVAALDLQRYFDTQDTARALYVFAARFGTTVMTDEQRGRVASWSENLGSRENIDSEVIFSARAEQGFFQVFLDATANPPLQRTIDRIRPTLQRIMGQYAMLLPAHEIDETLLEAARAVARCDGAGAADALAAYYDGPLEIFHDRLRSVPPFSEQATRSS